jgi:hypothetical protein
MMLECGMAAQLQAAAANSEKCRRALDRPNRRAACSRAGDWILGKMIQVAEPAFGAKRGNPPESHSRTAIHPTADPMNAPAMMSLRKW